MPPILEFWAGRASTVIVGDFNARPGDPEITMIPEARLQDSFAEVGTGLVYIYAWNDPRKRIDYVFVSPDLTPSDVDIAESTA